LGFNFAVTTTTTTTTKQQPDLIAEMNLGLDSLVPAMLSSSATPWAEGATE